MSVQSRRNSKRDAIVVVILVVVAASLIAYLASSSSGDDEEKAQDGDSGSSVLTDLPRREADDPLAMGEPDAPVTMLIYSDYRCPFCAKFSQDTQPELVDDYVESGVLRLEWRDLPIFGEESMNAARAGRAAAEQDKFWEYNDAVYEAAPEGTDHPDLPPEVLRGFAEDVGLDLEQFDEDLESAEFDQEIDADYEEAGTIRASSTPTFVINDGIMVGAQDTSTFVEVIEEAAEEA